MVFLQCCNACQRNSRLYVTNVAVGGYCNCHRSSNFVSVNCDYFLLI